MLPLESCCCCILLRTGCLILGYMYLICDIVQAVFSINILVTGLSFYRLGSEELNLMGLIFIVCSSITLFLIGLFFIFNILLLFGLHKDRRSYVKAFLIYYLIYLILWALMFIVAIIVGTSPLVIILSLLGLGISIYFLLVIRSYFEEMGKTDLDRARGRKP